jgi:hypothetical protein
MALKVKPKAETKPAKAVDHAANLAEQAQAYRDLEKKIEKFKHSVQAEFDELKKGFIAYGNENLDADQELEIPVPGCKPVRIGPQGTTRTITDMEKAVEMIGEDTFLKIAKISMADVDKYLRPEQIEQVVTAERNESRRVT